MQVELGSSQSECLQECGLAKKSPGSLSTPLALTHQISRVASWEDKEDRKREEEWGSLYGHGTGGVCGQRDCGLGQQCVRDEQTGRGKCVCVERCRPHYKPVCGSDGHLYQNHCELHRSACLTQRKITIMHSEECFYKGTSGRTHLLVKLNLLAL
ncbi:hypothetical protein ACEWY4_015604 [Coilia grayii]|uniref:Kazal-like domain-containing protein n=1 Tax=Coilia grayii TaxID=363190 RepID=A0ABD1JPI0_9TELE